MDEKQARQLVRNQFHLLDLSKIVMQRSDDALNQAIVNAAAMIKTLPPAGDLMREKAWQEMKPMISGMFDQAAGSMGKETIAVLTEEVKSQVEFSAAYVNGGTRPELEWSGRSTLNGQPLTGVAVPAGEGIGLAPGGAPGATPPFAQETTTRAIGATGSQAFTVKVPRNIYSAVKDVRIAGATLQRTFGSAVIDGGTAVTVGTPKTGLGRFMVNDIDRRVRQGFLMGQSTEAIAQDLFIDAIRGGGQLGPTALQLKRGANTVARTAVQDLSTHVHEKVWDANSDRIAAYEFDASSDSRTCPTCTALDGKTGTKEEVPRPPVHPNCRCAKLPLTRTELELRKQGDVPTGTGIELVSPDEMPIKQRKGESQRQYIQRVKKQAPSGERWYAQPVNQNGKRFYRRARDLKEPGGVVKFLADPKTTDSTLDQFFGGGNAGIVRRKWFQSQIAKGKAPQDAFAEMLNFRGMTNRSVKPSQLGKLKPVQDLRGANDIRVTRSDIHRPISRARRPRQQPVQP